MIKVQFTTWYSVMINELVRTELGTNLIQINY